MRDPDFWVMQRYDDAAFAAARAAPDPPTFTDDVRGRAEAMAWVDEQLRELASYEQEIAVVQETAQRRIEDAQAWAAREAEKWQREVTYRRTMLEQAAKSFPYPRDRKSVSLPYGSIGTRVQPLSVEISDSAKALAYSYAEDIALNASLTVNTPEAVSLLADFAERMGWEAHLCTTPRKEALLAHAKEQRATDPAWLPHALDDGWTINGGEPEAFVKPRTQDGG